MQCDVQKTNLFFGFSKVKYYLCSRDDEHNLQTGTDWLLASMINAD